MEFDAACLVYSDLSEVVLENCYVISGCVRLCQVVSGCVRLCQVVSGCVRLWLVVQVMEGAVCFTSG